MMDAKSKLALSSSSFEDGQSIPRKYTCDGEDVSPITPRQRIFARTAEPPSVQAIQ